MPRRRARAHAVGTSQTNLSVQLGVVAEHWPWTIHIVNLCG
jgi:hypothetical protein